MDITIPINRKRFPVVFLVSLLLTIALSLIYFKTDSTYMMDPFFNWIFKALILLVPLSYTIISLADFIKTMVDKKAALIISDLGLYDNLNIFSCGKIPWKEIADVEIRKALKTDFLVVKLQDADKYLAGKNFIERIALKKCIKKWQSPVIISERRIDYNLEELKKIILTYKANEKSLPNK